MWIKTCDGMYVNSDLVTKVEYYGGGTVVHLVGDGHATYISRKQDVRDDLVRHIISKTSFVEYGGTNHG